MTSTVSRPVQIFAVLGIVGALGFAVFNFTAGSGGASTAAEPLVPASIQPSARPAQQPAAARRPAAATGTRSGFPAQVDSALRRKPVVVVAVYMPRAGVDLALRTEAQVAAARTGAAFVAVRATNERVVRPLFAKVGLVSDPSVLVVRRPGVVVAQLGVTDRQTIAQAVAQSRR